MQTCMTGATVFSAANLVSMAPYSSQHNYYKCSLYSASNTEKLGIGLAMGPKAT